MTRLRRKAERARQSDLDLIRSWWSRKYELPPSDPRFLSVPLAEHVVDFLTDMADRREEIRQRLSEEPDQSARSELEEALSAVEAVLGVESTGRSADRWAAEVEEALEQGRMPNWKV